MRKWRYIVPVVGGCLPLAAAGQGAAEKPAPRPNVLLIYADDVGFGDLSCNGYGSVPTPHVERLAREGIRFTNAHCAASTSTPARYSMLTGEFAWRRPGTGVARGDAAAIIPAGCYTMADLFRDCGYRTAVVGKWHLGLGSQTGAQNWNEEVRPNPADLGFGYSYIMAATADRTPCIFMENGRGVNLDPDDPVEVSYERNFPGEPTGRDNPELLRMHPSEGHDQSIVNGISRIGYMRGGRSALWRDEYIADSIVCHAVRFIGDCAGAGEPFFLYFATNDIHVPRVPHPRFAGKSGLGPRGDAILSFDWSVGCVLAALDSLGLAENTLVILSSDNGPVVDDGYRDQARELLGAHKPGGDFRGGKYSIYEAGTRVPCVVRWPGTVPAGVVTDALAGQVDWFASLAAMLGATLPEGVAPDSEEHLATWLRGAEGRTMLAYQSNNENVTLTDGRWKYVPPFTGPRYAWGTGIELGNSPGDQLYDMQADPEERHNVAAEHPAVVERLRGELRKLGFRFKR